MVQGEDTGWYAARRIYNRWLAPRIQSDLSRQRVKLLWYGWHYLALLRSLEYSIRDRILLTARFLTIDWNVVHAHTPDEFIMIARMLASRPARRGEIIVEAGCWQGGSSAKFSILCRLLDYRLHIYDSFAGVERIGAEPGAHDFSGEYASPKSVLVENLRRYAEPDVCLIHEGWFAGTLKHGVSGPVRLAYIDCDLAKGTLEALEGIVPSLVDDGIVFSQDFHIRPVRALLEDRTTWSRFDRGAARITKIGRCLAVIRFVGLSA